MLKFLASFLRRRPPLPAKIVGTGLESTSSPHNSGYAWAQNSTFSSDGGAALGRLLARGFSDLERENTFLKGLISQIEQRLASANAKIQECKEAESMLWKILFFLAGLMTIFILGIYFGIVHISFL